MQKDEREKQESIAKKRGEEVMRKLQDNMVMVSGYKGSPLSYLEPCPFCASDGEFLFVNAQDNVTANKCWVECSNCGAKGSVGYCRNPDDINETACYGWNDRV